MRIVYHHRTRSTDAQRIHIREITLAFQELGHKVDIVALVPLEAGCQNAERDAGDPLWKKIVRRIPFSYEAVQLAYNLIGIPLLVASLFRRRADFIYERYSLFNFAGVFVSRLFRIPLMLEVNSPFALEQQRDGEIHLRRFGAFCERTICNMAERVIVVSSPLKRIMSDAGVKNDKLRIMTNGVRLEHFHPEIRSQELALALDIEGYKVIGFVGWFRNWHGLDLLVEAFDLSGLAARRVKLLLIGDGPAMAELKALVCKKGLSQSVIFTGPLPHERVPAYLSLIDIAVQPAANEYCCPMKILEYMALGKPIVAPRQENIEELLREDEEAVFFQQNDARAFSRALQSLAGDSDLAYRMGQNCRNAITSRGYLWEKNASRVIDDISEGRRIKYRKAVFSQ